MSGCAYANKVLLKNVIKKGRFYTVINTNTKVISGNQGFSFSFKKMFTFLHTYLGMYKILSVNVVYATPGQTFFGLMKYAPFLTLAILCNKPYVLHIHGNYLGTEYQRLSGWKKNVFAYFIQKASAGIVLSTSLRKNFLNLLTEDKVYTVENFVEEDLLKNASPEKPVDMPRIAYMSNLMEEKGILDVLDALIILDDTMNFHALFAGEIEDNIKELVLSKIGALKNKAEYMGHIEKEEKFNMLYASNIFILPTYYSMEGQPIALLEGLAAGNILITTRHAGIPDIINESHGYFVQKKSPQDIADALQIINKDLIGNLKKFSNNNTCYALSSFSEEKFVNKIEKILEKVKVMKD